MVRTSVINRKSRMKLKQYLIILMVFLVTFNGMVPSTILVGAQTLEETTFEKPNVSKDFDSESKKEITKGEVFNYNVKISLPEDVSGYETMTILDDLDEHLAIQSTQILVDEEVDDTLKADVKAQKVELSLTQEELETFAGKEVQLQITTQINENTTIEGEIENIAEIVINEDIDLKTDPAIVTLIESSESEESSKEESVKEEDTEKSEEVVEEETDKSETPISDNAESKKSEEVVEIVTEKAEEVVEGDPEISGTDEMKEESRAIQPMNAGEFEINHVDSYGNSWEAPSIIYQFDGNNPSATPKASLTIRGVAATKYLNGLALSKQNNRFYIASGSELFRIDPDGASIKVTDLLGPTGNGAMSIDGTEYYYSYGQGGKVYFGSFDLISRKHNSIEVKGLGSGINSLGGDLLVDDEGLVWFTQGDRLIQFDPTDGNVILDTELPTEDPNATGRGLSFLPDGRMLLAGGAGNDSNPMLYIYDPVLHEINYLGTMPGAVIVDLASVITPSFTPPAPGKLKVIKEDEEDGTKLAGATFELKDADDNVLGILETDENGEAVSTELEAGTYSLIETIAPEGYELINESLEVIIESDKPTLITVENTKISGSVDPKDPKPHSEKESKIHKKADGNTDAENPEVGDTIRYTIQTKNTIEDSLIEALVITDKIPEGLTYVAGSLEVDGESVTDASDDDAGHVVDGKVTGNFGDITDTDNHTVTFLVTVDEGQAGKDIKNIATVDGDNIDEPDKPEEEVIVYPRKPKLESKKESKNKDADKQKFEVGDTIVYTIKTRNEISDSLVENLKITDELPAGLEYVEGSLNVSHDGEDTFNDGTITATFGDVTDTEWRTVTFEAKIKAGQSGKQINNTAKVDGDNVDKPDEPTEEVTVDPKDPKPHSEKESKIHKKADGNTDAENPEVGDTIRYTIQTKNTIEDSLIEALVITDKIPEGLTYVAGSLEVDGESVTDASDDDAGHVVDGKVTGNFGDITDTDNHTVTFLVTVDEGQAGKDIKNIAVVDSKNHDPDEPEETTVVYPREPVLESDKIAVNLEVGKEEFEVGDTIGYTIMVRNTISDSLVENLVITDELPAGLAFVEGSLSVSHDGEARFTDGVVTATFDSVEDTEWHMVTFEAKIESGQSGETIKNVATVDAENVLKSNRPEEKIMVEQKVSVTPVPEKAEPPVDIDETDVVKVPYTNKKEEGKSLPKTFTNIFSYILIGMMALFVGLVTLRKKKSSAK